MGFPFFASWSGRKTGVCRDKAMARPHTNRSVEIRASLQMSLNMESWRFSLSFIKTFCDCTRLNDKQTLDEAALHFKEKVIFFKIQHSPPLLIQKGVDPLIQISDVRRQVWDRCIDASGPHAGEPS